MMERYCAVIMHSQTFSFRRLSGKSRKLLTLRFFPRHSVPYATNISYRIPDTGKFMSSETHSSAPLPFRHYDRVRV